MARFTFKQGSMHYSPEMQDMILTFARRLARVMNKLSEEDARIVAFALDPSMDEYILGGWDKSNIIQESIETMVARNYSPAELANDNIVWNLESMADSISSGIY